MSETSVPLPSSGLFALENAPIGLVTTEYRIIQWCNRTFAEMFQYEPEDLIGQSFALLYPSNQEFEQIRDAGVPFLRETGKYWDERIMALNDCAPLSISRILLRGNSVTDSRSRAAILWKRLDVLVIGSAMRRPSQTASRTLSTSAITPAIAEIINRSTSEPICERGK